MTNRNLDQVKSDRKSPILTSLSKDLIYNSDRIIGAVRSSIDEEELVPGDIKVIGGISQFGSSSNRTINQVGEIGSDYLYVTVVDGQKSLTIGRQLIDTSLLRAFYNSVIEASGLDVSFTVQKILFDLDHPIFSMAIDIYDIVRARGDDLTQTAIDTTVYRNCQIARNTIPVMQGNDEIEESASFLYSNQDAIDNFAIPE